MHQSDSDIDISLTLNSFMVGLAEVAHSGSICLQPDKRKLFMFHVTQARQALARAGTIVDPSSFAFRRLVQRYDDLLRQIAGNGTPPDAS